MPKNKNQFSEEYQQARIIAVSKTAKSIKRIYTGLLLLFIIALVFSGLTIGKTIFEDKPVRLATDEPPVTNQILQNYNSPENISFLADTVDLNYPESVARNENWRNVNPFDRKDEIKPKVEDNIGAFDEKTLKMISDLMSDGNALFLQFEYSKASEKFEQILKLEKIPSSDKAIAEKYYDMSRAFRILSDDTKPFSSSYKGIRLTTPYGYTDVWHEGFVDASFDIETTTKIYLHYFHQNNIKELIINKNWKYEEITGNALKEKLKQLFILQKEELDFKNISEQHPFDKTKLGQFALSIGQFQGFDNKVIAHSLFTEAYNLDNFLYETICLHKDSLYTDWIVAISENKLVQAYGLRDRLKERYPRAWELRGRDPEAALEEIAKREAQKQDAEKTDDPDWKRKLDEYEKLSQAEKIAEFINNAKLAEQKADRIWREISDVVEHSRRNEMLNGAIFHWEQARKWYQEAMKLETNRASIEDIQSILVELNKKIFWARRSKTIERD